MASEKIVTISDQNFDTEVLNSEKPVLVDFWAEWCGPCRLVAPVLDELAEEREDVRVAKLNVDEHGDIAMRYQVQSIPTFILFKDGEVADRMLGPVPRAASNAFLSRNS